ncbi:protein arginine N-methyltransferase 9-like isoform X2 [Prorops nasuta]
MQLAFQNRHQDVLLCYQRSLDIFPTNARMLCNFAAHLLKNDNPEKAIVYLKRALKIEPTFLPAERNLQNAYSMVVDRWHFPMLNDKIRNSAFERAIRKFVAKGYNIVLDVGAGTGLLSLYAKDAGAEKVYACEYSLVMAKIAKKVFECNNAPNIKLIPKLSSDLRIPDDISERIKLVVTETFDAGLFGELIVPSMIDVHLNLLDYNQKGIIVPGSATLYIAGVECEHIRNRSSVIFSKIKDICSINFEHISVVSEDEFYDTENLENVCITYLTEPQELLKINFNNLLELQELNKDGVKAIMHAKCVCNGIMDGLVAWFKLHLDNEITIDSSYGKSCWQHAVFPSVPKVCNQKDIIVVTAKMLNGKLKCTYNTREKAYNNDKESVIAMTKEFITFLNDFEYIKLLSQMSDSYKDKNLPNVMDLSPFPIFGLLLLKNNKYCDNLYYVTDSSVLKSLILKVVNDNNMKGSLHFYSNFDQIPCKMDIILMHNFDIKGELKDWGQESYQEFFRDLLKPSGILLPQEVYFMGQLIYSEDLPKMVYVKDINLQNTSSDDSNSDKNSNQECAKNEICERYRIAKFINEYKIDQVFDLNSSLYMCHPLSDAQIMTQIVDGVQESAVTFRSIDMKNNESLPNALVCWYKVKLTNEYIYSTNRINSFMNHMAVIFEDDSQNVMPKAADIKIKIRQMNGLISVKVISN